jgi:membrane protein implicated in regulation of membrane protease activity
VTEIQNLLNEPGIAWLALAAVLAIVELLMPGIFLVFIAAGAAVTGLIALVLPLPIFAEIAIFAVASSIAVAIGRRWYSRHPIESSDPLLNDRIARLIGQTVTVSHAIVSGEGRVRVGDGEWPARGVDMPTGARVRVTGAKDGSLDVEPVAN